MPPFDPLLQSVPRVCTALLQESPAGKEHSQTHKNMCEKATSQTETHAIDKEIQNRSVSPDNSTLQTLGAAGHTSETTPSEAQNSALVLPSPRSLVACQRIEQPHPDAPKTAGNPCLPRELLDGQSVKEACRTVVSCQPSPRPARPEGTLHDSLAPNLAPHSKSRQHGVHRQLHDCRRPSRLSYTRSGGFKPSPRATMPNLMTAQYSLTTAHHNWTTVHHNLTTGQCINADYVLSSGASYRKLDGCKPSPRTTFPVQNLQYSLAANQPQYLQSKQDGLARKPCASYDQICHGCTQSGQNPTQATSVDRSNRRKSNSPLCIPHSRLEGIAAKTQDRCCSR